MNPIQKAASYLSRDLLRYPEILNSRFSLWERLRNLDEPAPFGIAVHAKSVQIQRISMKGVALRAFGGGQLPYIAKAVERLVIIESVGIRHGDLKTEHILLRPDGSVRWVDWDLAIFSETADRGEWAIGTPHFMAPEKITTGATTVKTEIFSIGKILSEQQEYKTNSALINFANQCMAKTPAERPQTFLEVFLKIKALL